jgi:aspergillopepsin I
MLIILQTGEAPLIAVEAGQVFLAPVTVGGQIFDVVIDTGSSDPWLVTPNFTCIDPYSGDTQAQTDCYFGTAYNPNQSSTYQPIPTENFNISYADQELLNGDMGYETFTFGGITVPHQKFGLVDYAGWYGDGYSSGLIGFAYGTLTSAYNGTDPSKDVRGGTLLYNPLFVSMYNLSLIAPIFSMAINRDPNDGGLLALGGIPDIPHSPCWISTAIQSVGFFIGTNTPAYEFYTVEINGFAFSASQYTQFDVLGTGNPAKTPIIEPASVIVDSGTSLVYAPNDVARGVALGFRPPAVFDSDTGAWYVACNATPPTFGVSIGHKIFFANGQDLIIPSSGGHCISGVQPKNDGLTILGDVWMKNVITVFDIGAAMMRFAAREYYSLNYARIQVTT